VTKLSVLGILLLSGGLGLLIFSPVTSSCVTDGDLTMCKTSASAVISGIGLVLIAIGCAAAVLGLPRRRTS
jgi:hypothetical protein